MANSLSELKRSSSSTLAKLKQIAEKSNQSSGSSKDDRFWSPTFDKEKGRGAAVIRFLPEAPGEEMPYQKIFSHGFKGPTGKWYIENSLSTIGKQDPVGSLNSRLWNSGVESDKQVARDQKRKVSYYSNILVIKDPANPENEGKVFLYRYGQKIYDMIQAAMFPEDDGLGATEGFNPFNPWEGANFTIKIVGVQIGNQVVPNYDKSYFEAKSVIGTDEEIDRVWNKCYSLNELVAPNKFKSEEELKKRLYEVLGATVGSGVQTVEGWGEAPKESARPAAPREDKPVTQSSSDEDDYDSDALIRELKDLM